MTNFKDARREQTSLLAPLERAALRGLARRMPARVNSDHLSLLGLFAMLLAGVFYAASGRSPLLLHLVNVCIFSTGLATASTGRSRDFAIANVLATVFMLTTSSILSAPCS